LHGLVHRMERIVYYLIGQIAVPKLTWEHWHIGLPIH
jgi:hypothetical protein